MKKISNYISKTAGRKLLKLPTAVSNSNQQYRCEIWEHEDDYVELTFEAGSGVGISMHLTKDSLKKLKQFL